MVAIQALGLFGPKAWAAIPDLRALSTKTGRKSEVFREAAAAALEAIEGRHQSRTPWRSAGHAGDA